MSPNKTGFAPLIIRISLIGVAALAAVMVIGWLFFRPVHVPADAVKLELTGSGRVTIKSSELYDVSGSKAQSLDRNVTVNISNTRTLKFKGTLSLKVLNGDVLITVADKTRIEPPNRQDFAFTVTDDTSVTVTGVLQGHFRVSKCKKLTANELATVTAIDCDEVQSFGKSDVVARGAKKVTANTWSHVTCEHCDNVSANDKSHVEVTNCGDVIASGTSQVKADKCKSLVARDRSEVKYSDCDSVDIQDKAKQVWLFSVFR